MWCLVFLAGHDHIWLRGRLESSNNWELDTREPGIPDQIRVDDELVTHWMRELPDPCDLQVNALPVVVEGKVVDTQSVKRLTRRQQAAD